MYKKLISITALSIAFISCVQPDNGISEEKQHIVFEDLEAKAVCVEHWDLDNDLEISYQEASYALITNEFTGNERLKTFPELIHFKRNTEISKEAFKGCTNLQQIAFGENITAIKEYAFAGCSSLKEFAVPNHIRDIEEWSFKGCSSLEKISLPDSITVIKEGTFAECKKLSYIDIPSTVTTIDRQAFIASGLKSVNIFSNVEKIEESAFHYCDSLVKVYCTATTPPAIGHYPFLGCKALEVIFVPIESVETYKKEWYNYSSYIEGYTPSEDVVRINNEFISVAPEGMVLEIKVESNIPYNIIISNPEWIKQEQVTRGFLTSDTCYFCISANRTSSTRNAYIVFTSKDNGTISDTLRIIQESNICNLPYYESFENSLGKFTNQTTSGEGAWINDYKTAKATGYDNASQTTTAGTYYLISPEISLEGVEEAYIAYEYILHYNKGDENQKVLIAESTEEPEWTVLNTKHTEGRDWSTFETAELNIPAEYVGKTIRIAFYYNTNNVSGSTWEVRNFSIQEGKVAESGDDPNAVKFLPYSESFSSSLGSFVNETISGSGEWINDYQTANATGYDNASKVTTAGTYYLISPQISLEGVTEAHVAYEYILRYNKGNENQRVLISADYTDDATMATWAVLKADHTEGTDWVTFESADINIPAEYMGKTIRIAFYYNTNNVSGSTWEVRNFSIQEGKIIEENGNKDEGGEEEEPETPDTPSGTYYSNTLLGDEGSFTAYDISLGSLSYVWQNTTSYGWKASAYSGGAVAAEAWLVSPAIDLSAAKNPIMTFEQALNYLNSGNRADFINLYISTDFANDIAAATWEEVSLDAWPAGSDWGYITSTANLATYAGKSIHIAFKYVSTSAVAPTWEFKNLTIAEK